MNWYFQAFKKYAEFEGRARRKEYWLFLLIHAFIIVAFFAIDTLVGTVAVFTGIYALATLIPTLAVTVRRLHDTGRSGWWYFIAFVPCIGGIVLFVFAVLDSDPNDNPYGANPKASTA